MGRTQRLEETMLQRRAVLVRAILAFTVVAAAGTKPLRANCPNTGAALVDRYATAINNQDVNGLAEVIAGKYVQHNGRAGQRLAGTQATFRFYFETFPDIWSDIEIWRVADGKFVEHWDQSDLLGLARQMRGD
jgi:predicted SnoaL-like aldol condensation-catalyzing enzyme